MMKTRIWLVLACLIGLVWANAADAQKDNRTKRSVKASYTSAAGVWKSPRLPQGKGTIVLTLKRDRTFVQKNIENPKDFDPQYDTGTWSQRGNKVVIVRKAKNAVAQPHTLSRSGQELDDFEFGGMHFRRVK